MMESLLPLGIAVASIALTYFVCIRPMRGHCVMMPGYEAGRRDSEAKEEIARLRSEVAELRQAQGLDTTRRSASATRART